MFVPIVGQRLLTNVAVLCGSLLFHVHTSAAVVQPPVSHYEIDLKVDTAAAKMRVTGLWKTQPLASSSSSFRFLLSPLMRSLRISSVRCGRKPSRVVETTSHDSQGDRAWELRFHQSCPAGRQIELAFSYETDGKAAPQLRIGADHGFAGSGGELWYPQRSFAERETARLTLDIPSRLTGIATGTLKRRAHHAGRTRETYLISTPAKLAFAYGRYRETRLGGRIPSSVLTFHSREPLELTADRLRQTLAPLAEAFGPAPFGQMALVEIDFQSKVLGVSEFGMIFADTSKIREGYDLVYWAHEFSHQWWGNAVRPASRSEGATLLTEGLAQYGALYALQQVEGRAAAEAYKKEGRGKDRRQSLAGYRALIAAGQDRPLVGPPPKTQEEILIGHRLATSKGALLLDALARLIGRENFHRILAVFVAAHRSEPTSWATLEAEINRATRDRYAVQIRSWFTDPGVPEPLRTPND